MRVLARVRAQAYSTHQYTLERFLERLKPEAHGHVHNRAFCSQPAFPSGVSPRFLPRLRGCVTAEGVSIAEAGAFCPHTRACLRQSLRRSPSEVLGVCRQSREGVRTWARTGEPGKVSDKSQPFALLLQAEQK